MYWTYRGQKTCTGDNMNYRPKIGILALCVRLRVCEMCEAMWDSCVQHPAGQVGNLAAAISD